MKLRIPLVALALLAVLAVPLSSGAGADHSSSGAAVHPGVMTFTNGAQCTANFVFTDGTSTYIGQAAHCASEGAATDTNGCTAGTLPEGTAVEVSGAQHPATMVYSSWVAMQRKGETDPNACAYNDFALVQLDPRDAANVDPTIPFWGGPDCLETGSTSAGESVYSYGNSSLRLGVSQLSPKQGTSLGTSGGGWTHTVYTASPGIPGDSGSAFLDSSGCALGVLSTVAIAPLAGSNGVGDLDNELTYMRANSPFSNVQLVPGRTRFNANAAAKAGSLLGV